MPELKTKPGATAVIKRDPRPVYYPTRDAIICEGPNAITLEQAQRFLGWEEEAEGGPKFGDRYFLQIPKGCEGEGKKVRCPGNTRNRPLTMSWCETLLQDILNHNWADSRNGGEALYALADGVAYDGEVGPGRTLTLPEETLNGETIIIGRHGQVLSGQHRLVSLILAVLKWRKDVEGGHWKTLWPAGEPTIEGVVVVGVAEGGRTTRTLDNVKPRTLADVLFCEAGVFGDKKLKSGDRAKLCRIAEFCVKNLWDRTGAKDDPFSPHRTHSEALEFIDRHGRVLKAVRHIFDEDASGMIGSKTLTAGEGENKATFENPCHTPPGLAAALLYLMGSSTSDPVKYREGGDGIPSERRLKWDNWAKAEEFWTLVAGRSPSLAGLFKALTQFTDPDTGINRITKAEKEAIYAKAWRAWAAGKPVTEKACRLTLEDDYTEDDVGVRQLKERPTFGGVDLGGGGKVKSETPEDGDDAAEGPEPTPEEVEARKAQLEQERAAKEAHDKEQRKKANSAAGPKTKTATAATPAAETKSAKGKATPAAEPGNGKAKRLTPAEALRAKQQQGAKEADDAKAAADALEAEVQAEAEAGGGGEDEPTLDEEMAAQED